VYRNEVEETCRKTEEMGGDIKLDIRETGERWIEWAEEILTRDRLS
jgi:hypothetical protein